MRKIPVILCLVLLVSAVTYLSAVQTRENYKLPSKGGVSEKLSSNSNILQKIENEFTKLSEEASRAVVSINTSKSISISSARDFPFDFPFEDFFGPGFRRPHKRPRRKHLQKGIGSGFVIDAKEGLILTNNHVIRNADVINVETSNKKTYQAKLIGADPNTDVAVIKVENLSSDIPGLTLAPEDNIKRGQWVLAIGAPLGLEQTITSGIIGHKGRGTLNITTYGDYIQTDAAINAGNSGGPLINIRGEVVGMNTAILSKTGDNNGIGLAIPSKILKDISEKLITYGKIERSYIGAYLQEIDDELAKEFKLKKTYGTLITKVIPGGPASKAGIKAGDVIVKFKDKEIKNGGELSYLVGNSTPGTKINIGLIRKGQLKTIPLTLEKMNNFREQKADDPVNKSNSWGMALESFQDDASKEDGLLVKVVTEGSPAERYGVREGDLIVEVNHRKVRTIKDFYKFNNQKNKILLRIRRSNMYRYIKIKK